MKSLRFLITLTLVAACGARPAPQAPQPPEAPEEASTPDHPLACNEQQITVSREADTRAAPWSIAQHLTKNFSDGRISWLMKDGSYQDFVVKTGAKKWGRCNDTGCYVFAAPAAVIHGAVEKSMVNGHHDPAAIGQALGLPAKNFEGPLRMMTFDLDDGAVCVRLPVDSDPGVWKCQTPEDKDCFKFGGYTSGGIPELMALDVPVDQTKIEEVP